ncbi:CRISPR-associated protein Cas5 [Clostridium baratii]|uniref:CRISPR-associated protein cas5 family n=1 Tax=Clostridium baratii TaxID=1561 RepID=A0A174VED3_9CLOT|nr:CRISPR-associated protein Cas5 [Clostridium baratii]CUQ30458.1 CRISPR-associated protein cas5 family [Clostridium baratii]
MKFKKIKIISEFAHFKIPYGSKIQSTYEIPPISTVIGIVKNLFYDRNYNLQNVVFGYTFEYKKKTYDIQKIYKDINLTEKALRERYNSDGYWISDVCKIEYLYKPILTIYIDIDKKFTIKEPLNLGKTDCLAKIVEIKDIEIEEKRSVATNQYTSINIGEGVIKRIACDTLYNLNKGIYDINTLLVRENSIFNSKWTISDENKGVFLWQKKEGSLYEF